MSPFHKEETRLHQAWVRELNRAFQSICWGYRVPLHDRPMIEISRSHKEWGAWDPLWRTIRISADLILHHPWDVTLNVFKHEMAHQIVTDLWGSEDGHGPLFERACDMIGVPEAFRGAGGDAPRTIGEMWREPIDRGSMGMLEKVRKLLSLARSANENEAFLAMAKANELIEKYHMDRIAKDKAHGYTYAIIHHKKRRIENYQRRICVILRDHFLVETVCSRLYDPIADKTYQTIELLGTVENVRIAEYVYHFLMNQMDILWKAHQQNGRGAGLRNKRSYRLGVLEGFHDRLDRQAEERRRRHSPDRAANVSLVPLILHEKARLESFVRTRFPRLATSRSVSTRLDPSTFQAGIEDGGRLTLHKGIHDKDGYQGRLLPAQPEGHGR